MDYCPVIDGGCEWADADEEICDHPRHLEDDFPNQCPDPDDEEHVDD